MEGQSGTREETSSLEQRGPATGRGQYAVQPSSEPSALYRRRRLPRLNQATVTALLIVILIAASVLVALITCWIGH